MGGQAQLPHPEQDPQLWWEKGRDGVGRSFLSPSNDGKGLHTNGIILTLLLMPLISFLWTHVGQFCCMGGPWKLRVGTAWKFSMYNCFYIQLEQQKIISIRDSSKTN